MSHTLEAAGEDPAGAEGAEGSAPETEKDFCCWLPLLVLLLLLLPLSGSMGGG